MGCAPSTEVVHPPNSTNRTEESQDKKEQRKPADAQAPSPTPQPVPEQVTPQPPPKAPDLNASPSAPPVVTPPTIAGYPVNTYTDGTTRVAVKCVILSRQKCDSVCRFLDSVRKARDRNGGVFRNPEEPIEVEPRRDIDTVSAASGRSKIEPSMSAVHNNSVTGNGMNVSMAVHVGHSEALSPGPHGGLANVPDLSSATPARTQERPVEKSAATTGAADPSNPTANRQDGEPIPGSVDVDAA